MKKETLWLPFMKQTWKLIHVRFINFYLINCIHDNLQLSDIGLWMTDAGFTCPAKYYSYSAVLFFVVDLW